jgi:cytidylate kinase
VFADGRCSSCRATRASRRAPGRCWPSTARPARASRRSAQAVAARLGWGHLDSGRCTAPSRRARSGSGPAPPPGALGRLARALCLDVDEDGRVLAEGRVVPEATLRSAAVSAQVSRVSADPEVRATLLDVQRGAARRPAAASSPRAAT